MRDMLVMLVDLLAKPLTEHVRAVLEQAQGVGSSAFAHRIRAECPDTFADYGAWSTQGPRL